MTEKDGGDRGTGSTGFSRGLILVVTLAAAALLIVNVVLVSCYVKRKGARKHLLGKNQRPLLYVFFSIAGIAEVRRHFATGLSSEKPTLGVIVGVAACGTALLLVNVAFISCAVKKCKREQKKKAERYKAAQSSVETASSSAAVTSCSQINAKATVSSSSTASTTSSTASTPECAEGKERTFR